MGYLDKLKNLIENTFKINIKGFNLTVNINKNSNNVIHLEEKGCYYEEKKNILHLNPDTLPKDIKEILPELIKEYFEEGNPLTELNTGELLEDLFQYGKDNSNKAILSFFKPIIPHEDYEALEASLFLRDKFNKGDHKHVRRLKEDIWKKFGRRGNNIANLCTARYFEDYLITLYNFSRKEFPKIYEDIVSKSIIAVFVHREMTIDDIVREIQTKVQQSKKYGIKFIYVHGISKSNIEAIKEGINKLHDQFYFLERKIYESKKLISIELILE